MSLRHRNSTAFGTTSTQIELVGTGVGCHISGLEMLELGADVLILTYDRVLQETVRLPLTEMNANIITVEHSVAEMLGMQSMAAYLKRTFPELSVTFYGNEPASTTFCPLGTSANSVIYANLYDAGL